MNGPPHEQNLFENVHMAARMAILWGADFLAPDCLSMGKKIAILPLSEKVCFQNKLLSKHSPSNCVDSFSMNFKLQFL